MSPPPATPPVRRGRQPGDVPVGGGAPGAERRTSQNSQYARPDEGPADPSPGPCPETEIQTAAETETEDDAQLLVADLTETELIARFTPLLPRGPATLVSTGDDAAVIAAPDGRFVVSTDVLVEDQHFRGRWGSPRDVGARAAAQNLADIAAMGAVSTTMVIALGMPPTTPVSWLLDLARGLADVCGPAGVGIDGGDLSAAGQLFVAVTVHGDLQGRTPVLRSGARPGDVLAHAGVLGHGAAGYAVLSARGAQQAADAEAAHGERAPRGDQPLREDDLARAADVARDDAALTGEVARTVVAAFLRPAPPLASGPAAADASATAMMDVSDGLLRDADRLARASGVDLLLDSLRTSVPQQLAYLALLAERLGEDPATWLLTGGEDHGMLATFPAGTPLPTGFRRLGEVGAHDGSAVRVHLSAADRTTDGAVDRRDGAGGGWDHFHG